MRLYVLILKSLLPLFGAEKLYVQLISTSTAGTLHVVGSPNDQQLCENGLLETIMQLLHKGLPSPRNVVKAGKFFIPILRKDGRGIQILLCSNSIRFYKRVGIWLSTLIGRQSPVNCPQLPPPCLQRGKAEKQKALFPLSLCNY